MDQLAKKTLTTGDIARHCGVNLRTVIRWIERGHLNAYKLPGRGDNRVPMDDFLDFLERNNMPMPKALQAQGNKVLIVEDEPAMAAAIQRVLERAGYETQIAHEGFRAGALLGTFQPDVMTLDLGLPGLPGLEVLRFVRGNEIFAQTRILVISATNRELLEDALQAGADAVLEKPFDNVVLMECVSQLTRQNCLPRGS